MVMFSYCGISYWMNILKWPKFFFLSAALIAVAVALAVGKVAAVGVSASFDQIRELEVWEGCSVPPEDHTTTHPLVEQSSPSSSSSKLTKPKLPKLTI